MNDQPAFPQNERITMARSIAKSQGMTLRDYFASKAMQAFLSDSDWRVDMGIDDTAYGAYKVADAMLKARET